MSRYSDDSISSNIVVWSFSFYIYFLCAVFHPTAVISPDNLHTRGIFIYILKLLNSPK